jgi:protein O-mannosyl-transferase
MKERHVITIALLGIFAIVLGVYWPVLEADFLHWDDDINVFENPNVQGLTAANLQWMFTDFEQAIRYKAFSWLAWAIVHEIFGLNPFGFHLANLFLHTMNAWLVFFLCLRLARFAGGPTGDVGRETIAAAGLAALVFALHPLRVEPVAWITGLPYHLSLLFLLSSVILYLRVDITRSAFGQQSYWGAAAMYLLAAMTYPIVLGFCAALIALDFSPLRRFQRDTGTGVSLWDGEAKQVWREKLPFVAVAGLIVAGTLYGRFFNVGTWFAAADTGQFTLAERTMQAFYGWAYYVWKPLWPTGLCPLYPTLLQFSPTNPVFLASAAGVVGLSVYLLLNWKRRPWALALWITHLGLLIPMLGLTERPHYPHDRYSIVNGALWSLLCLGILLRFRSKLTFVAGIAAVVLLGLLSHRQTAIWKNDITFFTHLAEHSGTPRLEAAAHMKLGNAYGENGEDLFALQHYDEAWETDPQFPFFQLPYNHGTALLRQGRVTAAAEMFRLALQIDGEHLGALNNLGVCRLNLKQLDLAITMFRRAVELAPDNPDSLFNLGSALADNGDPSAAIPILQRSLARNPMAPETHRRLADIYTAEGKTERAREHVQVALQIEAAREAMLNRTP